MQYFAFYAFSIATYIKELDSMFVECFVFPVVLVAHQTEACALYFVCYIMGNI